MRTATRTSCATWENLNLECLKLLLLFRVFTHTRQIGGARRSVITQSAHLHNTVCHNRAEFSYVIILQNSACSHTIYYDVRR